MDWRRLHVDTRPLRRRDFRNLWLGQMVSTIGANIAMVAVPYQVYKLTGSTDLQSCHSSSAMTLDLTRSPHQVGPDLIGAQLYVDNVGGVIVEVEAYDHEDPAAHGFGNRRTERNAAMFLGGGHVYVYRSYGIHWCMNIVCGEPGVAGAVLIRALKPTRNVQTMRERRGVRGIRALCSGPGKLCQALGVTREHDGLRVDEPPFILVPKAGEVEIVTGPRIGITKNPDVPWRYGWKGSRYLSRPFSGPR